MLPAFERTGCLIFPLNTAMFSHQVFANEVNAHRDQIIELDQTGNQLKFLSQKQDVVLIKNLLVSVQSRWEKIVQRSIERGRSLDDARKRAKQVSYKRKVLITKPSLTASLESLDEFT